MRDTITIEDFDKQIVEACEEFIEAQKKAAIVFGTKLGTALGLATVSELPEYITTASLDHHMVKVRLNLEESLEELLSSTIKETEALFTDEK